LQGVPLVAAYFDEADEQLPTSSSQIIMKLDKSFSVEDACSHLEVIRQVRLLHASHFWAMAGLYF
jgi:hypothetical protein